MPEQILPLNQYLSIEREALQAEYSMQTNSLFFSKSTSLEHVLKYLKPQLERQFPYFKNYQQLRNSYIVNRLKEMDVRRVQYLAGHKYVSSTEKYQQQDLEALQEGFESFHPLG